MRITAEHLRPSTPASPYSRTSPLHPLRQLTNVMLLLHTANVERSNSLEIARRDLDVCIKASTPASRGYGLFALREFEAGEIIGPYTGLLASDTDYIKARIQDRTTGDYSVLISTPYAGRKFFVDAEPDEKNERCLVSFINHSVRRQNCEFKERIIAPWLPAVPFVQVTRRVSAGSELFLDYGASYWDDKPGLEPWSVKRFIVDYW